MLKAAPATRVVSIFWWRVAHESMPDIADPGFGFDVSRYAQLR
jgi:hypothetical protein